jgi:hypothetical protein
MNWAALCNPLRDNHCLASLRTVERFVPSALRPALDSCLSALDFSGDFVACGDISGGEAGTPLKGTRMPLQVDIADFR